MLAVSARRYPHHQMFLTIMQSTRRRLCRLPWPVMLASFSLLAGLIGFCDTLPRPYASNAFRPPSHLVAAADDHAPVATQAPSVPDVLAQAVSSPLEVSTLRPGPTGSGVVAPQDGANGPPDAQTSTELGPSPPTPPEEPKPGVAVSVPGPVANNSSPPPVYAASAPVYPSPAETQSSEASVVAATTAPSPSTAVGQALPAPQPTTNSGPGKSGTAPGHNKGADGKPAKPDHNN